MNATVISISLNRIDIPQALDDPLDQFLPQIPSCVDDCLELLSHLYNMFSYQRHHTSHHTTLVLFDTPFFCMPKPYSRILMVL